ncbi:MAG: SDR family oxidoreductase [Cyanobacteria bacterium P01_A01_bin.84]
MKAVVFGATGETGRRIVLELKRHNIPVRAVVRDITKAKTILPEDVEILVADVSQPSLIKEAIGDCTVLLCATGATPSLDPTGPYKVDYEGNKNLVDAAKSMGIEHFVIVSSLCVSRFLHPLNLFWLILYWKKQAEEYIQSSGLTYTIVRPGGLKNEDSSDPIVMQSADTLFEGSIPRRKVAQVCVEALLYPQSRNKIVEIVANGNAPVKNTEELFSGVV